MSYYNSHQIDSSSGFETAAEEYLPNKSTVWDSVYDNYNYTTPLQNSEKKQDNESQYWDHKQKLEKIHRQKCVDVPDMAPFPVYKQKSFKSAKLVGLICLDINIRVF